LEICRWEKGLGDIPNHFQAAMHTLLGRRCCMSEDIFDRNKELGGILRQVSGQLGYALGNIYSALEHIAPADLRDGDAGVDRDAAILCQSYFRLLRLKDNLAEAGSLDGPNTAVLQNDDIVGFCREIVRRAWQPAELMGLELTFSCKKSSHILLMDSRRMERLLMNLLSNAFKFTPRGGRIVLEVRVGKEFVELAVADTGCGIRPELQDTVFDRYLHTERQDPPMHGLGLGLTICRRIAQEHGGSLLVTSKEGQGTTVTVSLPNRRDNTKRLEQRPLVLNGGFNETLKELSDALPKEAFTQKYLD